jgi:hypothetical protein
MMRDPGPRILNPWPWILNPMSWTSGPGSGLGPWILDFALGLGLGTQGQGSWNLGLGPCILDLGPRLLHPGLWHYRV